MRAAFSLGGSTGAHDHPQAVAMPPQIRTTVVSYQFQVRRAPAPPHALPPLLRENDGDHGPRTRHASGSTRSASANIRRRTSSYAADWLGERSVESTSNSSCATSSGP